MSNALSPETRPWVALASRLGGLATAVAGPIDASTSIALNTQGMYMVVTTALLTQGLLET